jgi:hypothetical protein
MNEASLAKSIDRLAEKKASDLLKQIRIDVDRLLEKYWRHTDAGGEYIGMDVRNALTAYAEMIGSSHSSPREVQPTVKLIDSCRSKILSDLLNGLPKLNEIAAMAAESKVGE